MQKGQLRIIDGLTYLGNDISDGRVRSSTPGMIDSLRRKYMMSAALCCPFSPAHTEYQNKKLFRAAREVAGLLPCPVVTPAQNAGSEDGYLDELIQKGARVCCMFHSVMNIPLDIRVVDSLFGALEKRRMPIALFAPEITDAADLASAFPRLPILLHGPSLRNRAFMPIFRRTSNLYLSTAPNYSHYRGLETISEEEGADRIIFASGYPDAEPGASVANLLYSDLRDTVRARIASENIIRLMSDVSGNRTKSFSFVEPTSGPVRDAAPCLSSHSRRLVPWRGAVDMHGHYGTYWKFPVRGGKGADLVGEMDRLGVEKIVVAHQACMSAEVRWGNDRVLAAMKRYPGRIAGYACCLPVEGHPGLEEVRRCVRAGMTGIKLHGSNGLAYTDHRCRPVWEFADRLRLPVLLHTWGDMGKYEEIFRNYRNVPVLLAHAGAGDAGLYVEYALKYENVYLELAYSKAPCGLVEYFVREAGADRILYGSDAPWMSMQHQLGRLMFADIKEGDKEKILVENPQRIMAAVASVEEA